MDIDRNVLTTLPNNGYDPELVMQVSGEEYAQINGVPVGPPVVSDSKSDPDPHRQDDVEDNHVSTQGRIRFVPKPVQQPTIEKAIRDTIKGDDPIVNYPKIGTTPYSEYDTPYLFTKLFPHLFPGGIGDPTNPELNQEVPLKKAIDHLLHLRYEDEDGSFTYPFAEDASFVFYAGNLLHRKALLQKGAVYFKRNPGAANLTKAQLVSLSEADFKTLMSKLTYYTGQVLMSPGIAPTNHTTHHLSQPPSHTPHIFCLYRILETKGQTA